MFVVCSRVEQTEQVAVVCTCIEAITKFHPNEKIVVVDSASSDKSYFEKLKKINPKVIIEDANNTAYETGAWWYAFDKYPNEETYCFLQDSLHLQRSIERFFPKNDEVTIFNNRATNSGWMHDFGETRSWAIANADLFGYELSSDDFKWKRFPIAIFNCFLATNNLMKRMSTRRLNKILPTNKTGSQAFERMWGVVFKHERQHIKKIPSKYFKKHFGGRE